LEPARRALLTGANTEAIQKTILQVKMRGDEYFYETARNTRDTATLNAYLNQAPLQTMSNEVSKYRDWQDEREKPRRIIFKLTKIKWNGIAPKGWTDGTKIKLFVNGSGDSRNSTDTGNARTGESSDASGIRSVTLENTKQIDDVPIVYQVWNVWWGDKELINKRVTFTPEKFLDQTTHLDGIGGEFTIEVEGVLPKPDLPSWHQ
jgi:hypothetical protein